MKYAIKNEAFKVINETTAGKVSRASIDNDVAIIFKKLKETITR